MHAPAACSCRPSRQASSVAPGQDPAFDAAVAATILPNHGRPRVSAHPSFNATSDGDLAGLQVREHAHCLWAALLHAPAHISRCTSVQDCACACLQALVCARMRGTVRAPVPSVWQGRGLCPRVHVEAHALHARVRPHVLKGHPAAYGFRMRAHVVATPLHARATRVPPKSGIAWQA